MDQVSKLSIITVLRYYYCLPQTYNNKITDYSCHSILMLPSKRLCWFMHMGAAGPQVHVPLSLVQESFTFSPHQLLYQNSWYV